MPQARSSRHLPAQRSSAKRVPAKRLLLLVLLVLALLLLFTLHRWLPGTWPGGGSSGFRRLDSSAPSDPTRLVAPVESSPEWTAAEGTTLRVVGPAGTPLEGWRIAVGTGGAFNGGADVTSLRSRDKALWTEGLRLRFPGGEVQHPVPAGLTPTEHVRVDVPAASVPPLRQAGDVQVRVVDAATGAPLPGATLTPANGAPLTADAQGHALLRGLREPSMLSAQAPDHAPTAALAHPQGGALEMRLEPVRRLDLRLVDRESGQELPVRAVRLVDAAGAELWSAPMGPPRLVRVSTALPASALQGARLIVQAPSRPMSEIPVQGNDERAALDDAGRSIGLTVRTAAAGAPVAGAQIRARYASRRMVALGLESPGLEERRTTGADGKAEVSVPDQGAALLIVEAPGHAPTAVRVAPGDTSGARDVVLERGVTVPVLVQDRHGRPLAGARVVSRCLVEGVVVATETTSDAVGRVRAGPVPPGPVEILAHAPGHAWGAADADAVATMGTVALRLLPGAPLRLVVHSPLGAPLAGVHVTALASDDAPTDAQPPEGRRWTTDEHGVLALEDLAARSYRLRLALAGHAEEVLEDVRPGAITYFATLVPRAAR